MRVLQDLSQAGGKWHACVQRGPCLQQHLNVSRCVRQARSLTMLQDALGIPRTVGLDLSADRIDMDQPLPALLVAEVDSLAVPELALEDDQTRYLCLSSDNRCATPQPCTLLRTSAQNLVFSSGCPPRAATLHQTAQSGCWRKGAFTYFGSSPRSLRL